MNKRQRKKYYNKIALEVHRHYFYRTINYSFTQREIEDIKKFFK